MGNVIEMRIPRKLSIWCESGTSLRQILSICTKLKIWVMETRTYVDDGEKAFFVFILGDGAGGHAKTAATLLMRHSSPISFAEGSDDTEQTTP